MSLLPLSCGMDIFRESLPSSFSVAMSSLTHPLCLSSAYPCCPCCLNDIGWVLSALCEALEQAERQTCRSKSDIDDNKYCDLWE